MSGNLAGFSPDDFRTQITNTMIMGLPNVDALKPTFYFRSVSTYPSGTLLDTTGKPIDARVQPNVTAPEPVQVPCTVEWVLDRTNNLEMVGTYWNDRVIVTLLDIHYALVQNAIEVELSGKRFLIQQLMSVGLGPVTVYQLQCFPKGIEQ